MLTRYNNAVDFTGEPRNVLEVMAWFKELIYEKGACLSMDEEEFRNISFLGDGRVWFESTGESGSEVLHEIADEFKVDFVHYFANNRTYGEAVCNQGKLAFTVLDEDDLGSISYNETNMNYHVGEVTFIGHQEAIKHLLAQKRLEKQNFHNESMVKGRLKR